MSYRPLTARLFAALFALALVAAACGDDSDGGADGGTGEATSAESTTTTAVSPESPDGAQGAAAGLRTDLGGLMAENVYLVALAADQGVEDGVTPEVVADGFAADEEEAESEEEAPAEPTSTDMALATLEANAEDLGRVVGSLYGLAAGEELLDRLNDRNVALLEYALARGANDTGAADAARQEIDAASERVASYLSDDLDISGAETLSPPAESLITTLDGAATDAPTGWTDQRAAAQEQIEVGSELAAAIADQQGTEGSVDSPGADLRADLASLLQEHVYLVGGLADEATAAGGVGAPPVAGADAALAENTTALADLFGDLYDDSARSEFAALWQARTDLLRDYVGASLSGDVDGAETAVADLRANQAELGDLIAANNELLAAEAASAELQPLTADLLAAVDATIEDDSERSMQLRATAQQMPITALTLAKSLQINA